MNSMILIKIKRWNLIKMNWIIYFWFKRIYRWKQVYHSFTNRIHSSEFSYPNIVIYF